MHVFVAGGSAVATARPDVVVHQMTAISPAHAGKPDIKHPDKWFAITNRLRSTGTDNLLAASEATGVPHFVSQGYASWNGEPEGGWVKTEEDSLNLMAGTAAHAGLVTLQQAEEKVLKTGGAVLRYGAFYGPGAIDDQVTLLRKRQYPLVGSGAGYSSWIHLDDAAAKSRRRRAVGGGVPAAQCPRAPAHGLRASALRGRAGQAGGTCRPVLRSLPPGRRRDTA